MMTHTCPAVGCTKRMPSTMLMCGKHWRLVPVPIQRRIWRSYRKGPTAHTATDDYMRAVADAVKAVADAEPKPAPPAPPEQGSLL